MLYLLLLLGLVLGQLEVTEARQHRTIQLSGTQLKKHSGLFYGDRGKNPT